MQRPLESRNTVTCCSLSKPNRWEFFLKVWIIYLLLISSCILSYCRVADEESISTSRKPDSGIPVEQDNSEVTEKNYDVELGILGNGEASHQSTNRAATKGTDTREADISSSRHLHELHGNLSLEDEPSGEGTSVLTPDHEEVLREKVEVEVTDQPAGDRNFQEELAHEKFALRSLAERLPATGRYPMCRAKLQSKATSSPAGLVGVKDLPFLYWLLVDPRLVCDNYHESEGDVHLVEQTFPPERSDDLARETEKERPVRIRPMGLEEYRKAVTEKVGVVGNNNSVLPRHVRRKNEGDRFNYAAASHGAKIVEANREAKGAGAVLDEDKDKYMRSPCSIQGKFILIELSETLTLVDEIVIANYEFFSSSVKEFELSGSRQFPSNEWHPLGRFEARNVRTPQSFQVEALVDTPIRYVKVKLLTHHGSEAICTLSLVRVYGVNELESLREELEVTSTHGHDAAGHPGRDSPTVQIVAPADSNAPLPNDSIPIQGSSDVTNSTIEAEAGETSSSGQENSGVVEGEFEGSSPTGVTIGKDLQITDPDNAFTDDPNEVAGGGQKPSVEVLDVSEMAQTDHENITLPDVPLPIVTPSDFASSPSIPEKIDNVPSGNVLPTALAAAGSLNGITIRSGGDFVLKTLMNRLKGVEVNQSLLDEYVVDLNQKYLAMMNDMDSELNNLRGRIANLTITTTTLASLLQNEKDGRAEDLITMQSLLHQHAQKSLSSVSTVRLELEALEHRFVGLLVLLVLLFLLVEMVHCAMFFRCRVANHK